MRVITRRADASPTCWVDPAGHVVTPNPAGWFDVKSGHSGVVYKVTTDGECPCDGFAARLSCSHLSAVLRHARIVLGRIR